MKTFIQIALFLSLFTYVACKSSRVEVSSRNFQEQVDLQQNLVFTFNNDLVADSLLNQWDSTAYVEFSPSVRGKFKWTSANELLFSPEAGFRPSTDYQAKLTSAVLNRAATTGSKESYKLADNLLFSFHTPYLTLLNTDVHWAKNENGSTEARFNLNFNYQVNPSQVANLLQIQIDGKNVSPKVTSATISETVSVAVTQPSGMNYDGKTATVTVRPGLKCVPSDYVTKQPLQLASEVPSKGEFRIVQVLTDYDGETGYVQVYTNQTVESNRLSQFISVDPEITVSAEPRDFGFIIKGDFKAGNYSLKISKQLRGIFGGALPEDYQQAVVFGEMKPYIAFTTSKSLYLTSKGSKNVGVRIINVPRVKVTVYKIYENNILNFLRSNGVIGSYYYGEEYEPSYEFGNDEDNPYGDVVMEKEVATSSLSKSGSAHLLNLELNDLNDRKGMYAVRVSSTEDQWLNDTRLVAISDVGLMVKETAEEIHVFANSILTASPMAGVSVSFISSNNQNLYTAETDANGIARFSDVQQQAPNFHVRMITARQGGDFTYLLFDQSKVETSRYEVGGSRDNPTGYQAFIYGDRNIYRPGETIHLNTIIRNAGWQTVKEFPVKLKVVQPNGKEFTTLKGNVNDEGAFATSVNLPVSAVTGTYMVEAYTANDVLLASRAVSVEEFIPDRIKVNVNVNKTAFQLSEDIPVQATALNLFGPPAANRTYEVTFQASRAAFSPRNYPDYTFYPAGEREINFEEDVREGKTDAEGQLQESFRLPDSYQNIGVLSGSIFTTVFDETGRPVNRVNRVNIFTQDVFYGIRGGDWYVNTNQPVQVGLIALDKTEKPLASAKARVQVVKFNWQTALVRNESGSYNYTSQKKEQYIEEKMVTIGSSGLVYSYVPRLSGEYEIRVIQPGTESYVSREFYAYGYGNTQNASFEVDKEGQITVELDKASYQPGDEAKVLLKTPFAGKVLVSVERNKVFDYQYINTDKKSASLTIPIKKEYLPNVYITATLIKPVTDNAVPLTVAHGFAPLHVVVPETKLAVAITAAAQSGSKTKQTITVKTAPRAEVTLAVVDEGILQLKNYQSPDPHDYFYAKRALEVNNYDLYPRLFPELTSGMSSVGGDGYDLERRVNPLTNKRVNLVSFWSGTRQADGNGEVTYTIDIPQFSGDLRIMAVAYKENAFGSANKNMKVADPVVVSTAMPRFLSPGDQLQVPVTLSNTTKQNATAVARIAVTGGLEATGDTEQRVEIAANSEAQVQFAVNAAQTVGTGQVTVTVTALNKTFTEQTDITIRPVTSLLKQSGSGTVAAGAAQNLNLATDFVPSSTRAKLVLSRSPVAQFAGDLDYLIFYPYGCVEQITSGAFPQLYVNELSRSLQSSQAAAMQTGTQMKQTVANLNVQGAIQRLQAMQLYNGALSYWPGGGYESWWGTVYATHFLLEARKAGFQVNAPVLERTLQYVQQQVKQKKSEQYFFYNQSGQRLSKKIAPKEVAYSLFVLALAGEADVATMNYYKSNRSMLAIDSKYLLAATYQLLGDKGSAQGIIPSAFSGERSVQAFGGSFYSYLRDEAISLNALIDSDPKNGQIPVMARHLSEQLKQQKYLNTQERAFALLALGKLARQNAGSQVTAQVKSGERTIGEFNGEELILTKVANLPLRVQTGGSGTLYYFWQAEGLSASGEVKEEDSFLRVRKTFYNRSGSQLSGNSFQQNDLVVVKITLASTDGAEVDNVVITDMLPAGFEIENPRISDLPDLAWATNAAIPQHFDVRDDRLNLFATATGEPQTFYYVVRAVSKGTFRMGPVSADAMYNGDYHSLSGAGEIRVTGGEGGLMGAGE